MITNYLSRGKSTHNGTHGIFSMPDFKWCCHSLERPWLLNAVNISCIPEGEYLVKWTYSNHFKRYTYQIMDVPERTGIRFHPGNKIDDSEGCPMLGFKIQKSKTTWLIESQDAISEFEILMNKNPFSLVII